MGDELLLEALKGYRSKFSNDFSMVQNLIKTILKTGGRVTEACLRYEVNRGTPDNEYIEVIIDAIIRTHEKVTEQTLNEVLKRQYSPGGIKIALDAIYLTYGAFSLETLKKCLQSKDFDLAFKKQAFGAYFRAGGKLEALPDEIKALAESNKIDPNAIAEKVFKQEIKKTANYIHKVKTSNGPNSYLWYLPEGVIDNLAEYTSYNQHLTTDQNKANAKSLLPQRKTPQIVLTPSATISFDEVKNLARDIQPDSAENKLLLNLINSLDASYSDRALIKILKDISSLLKTSIEKLSNSKLPGIFRSESTRQTLQTYKQLDKKIDELLTTLRNSINNNNNNNLQIRLAK